jgi:hypothetical protein
MTQKNVQAEENLKPCLQCGEIPSFKFFVTKGIFYCACSRSPLLSRGCAEDAWNKGLRFETGIADILKRSEERLQYQAVAETATTKKRKKRGAR